MVASTSSLEESAITITEQLAVVPSKDNDGYILIYLDEAAEDNETEMGASFEGRLEYSSGDGSNALTGSFTVAAPEEDPEDQG